MDLYDFYFRQIVTQAVMDWVFDRAQQADHDQSADNVLTGVMEGLGVTENHLGADLSVDVAGGVAFTAEGARVFVPALVTNLDCTVDEFGVPTIVGSGNERWLSVFARFSRDLQDPELDGNGLEVYTKQLESFELVVHQGAEDTVGLASKPALLTNAVLLADINLVFNQSTITTVSDIFVERRQDWIRVIGTSLPDFVHGNARDALEDLFAVVDAWSGGGAPFSFTSTWVGAAPVLGAGFPPPPATVFEALDAIVYDLGKTTPLDGANRIGIGAYMTPFGYVSWPAGLLYVALTEIADAIDAHINGSPPQHPASSITTLAYEDWAWLRVSTADGFSPGTITNEDSEQATLMEIYDVGFGTWFLLRDASGSNWQADKGLDMGASYSSPPDAMILDEDIALFDIADGSNVQSVLQYAVQQMYKRPRLDLPQIVTGERTHMAPVQLNHAVATASLTGGAGDYKGPISALQNAPLTTGNDGRWPCPYDNVIQQPANNNYVDLCRGWDYKRNNHCVFVVGDEPTVDLFYPQYDDNDFARAIRGNMTTDAGGTLLAAPATPVAVCSNGPQLFVLVDPTGAGTSGVLYAYDARYVGHIEELIFQWSTALPYALGSRKADSRIVCNDTYVWILFGNEDLTTGNPLGRVDAADGTSLTVGKGDGTGIGGAITPSGGLAVVDGSTPAVLFTATSLGGSTLVPATWSLGSTGLGEMTLSGESREVVVAGRFIVCPVFHYGAPSANPFAALEYWDFQDDTKGGDFRIYNLTDITVNDVQASFDGMTIWVKFARGNIANEHHMVVGVNPSQFVPGEIISPTAEDKYLVTAPRSSGGAYGFPMGRFVAWGPALWHIPLEAEDYEIFFQPGAGLFFK